MIIPALSEPSTASTSSPQARSSSGPRRSSALSVILSLWLVIFFASLFAPPLLDDADATHANAARNMALTGDLVTLKVNGIRYLEKAALPYWLDAISFRIFGFNTFAAHLPEAIGVLLLALLGYHWGRRAYGDRTAFYTGVFALTSAGVFLFTRIYIPEVLLSLFILTALYCLLRTLEETSRQRPLYAYTMWAMLALAVLTKGLVALVFFGGAAIFYLTLTRQWRNVGRTRIASGLLLFFAIAAPWHILAGLRNTGGMNGHGFFWFYFVNEHFLRFLGKRYPKDYNKLPGYLFWSLHLVWLFPWSLFSPLAVIQGWRLRRSRPGTSINFSTGTTWLLLIYGALVLVFFSISTNQEYYTFPAYLAILILMAVALVCAEQSYDVDQTSRRWIIAAHATYTVIGIAAAAALGYGLWSSRNLPFVPDIGELLAHRGVGDYTLSMSHFFDLTGPSFAALRLPATLAALSFAFGPAIAWWLRSRRRHLASTVAIALTSTVFLVAAHIALVRFAPMLSSANLAQKIIQLEDQHLVSQDSEILLYGDQAYGSSIPFYLGKIVYLVDGRSTSMLFGSTFPDAPPIFLTHDDLLRTWGTGPRKILFVPLEKRDVVDRLLGDNKVLLAETSGKALFTDRPLDHPSSR
ncbi:glycosyltransferase family 39 protein [Edaphobacter sp. 12200R-103]|uniref:ArnT family glycosyltransferase n=1 Tax=Edaphobacter sp. 12200R-103 TaxID=2703788 RepID=UPI00138C2B2F|nr:glycosyltransferase family 39 protein [Edaphobacter sp. 12200R-103]QHS53547.1 glycosyltransferase family 39 protein [Edaphobacter sp. 12200R-103]